MSLDVAPVVLVGVAFLFGLVFGSFGNVVIHRAPRRQEIAGSVTTPAGSYCPQCREAIRWFDNIPLVSFALLKGRCRACEAPIPWRYPAVELACGVLFAGSAMAYGLSVRFGIAAWFLWNMLVLAVIDGVGVPAAEYDDPFPEEGEELPPIVHVLPDKIVLPALGAAIAFAAAGEAAGLALRVRPWMPLVPMPARGILAVPLMPSLFGLVVGGGSLLLLAALWRGGMGGGDIKLAALMGVVLGPYVLLAEFLGSAAGAVVSIAQMAAGRRSRKDLVPFGPFLALAAVVTLFWGPPIVAWYARMVGLR